MAHLVAKEIVKRYRKRVVVDAASLEVASGEVVGLLGPNGAGKTTSFYMMGGLIHCDEGRVLLDERDLTRALAEVFEHKVDYADLYFQYTRSEGWSLEEGIVKSGSFSIEQGVGVRAVAGEKTAFAYSDEINAGALLSAARATRRSRSRTSVSSST